MLRRNIFWGAAIAFTLVFAVPLHAKRPSANSSKDLKISVVDAEGGAATLFLTPEGKSLLIDVGWPPGFVFPRPKPGDPPASPTTSTADRIIAAASAMGITKIDYLEITHYHGDHLGGLQALLEKIPVDTFIDHGPNRQPSPANAEGQKSKMATGTLYGAWEEAYRAHHHIQAQAGQTLQIGSLNIKFVASDGKVLTEALHGAGRPNPQCKNVVPKEASSGEDPASLGELITFGKTKILDLGDLTWDKELDMVCPTNKIGKVDVYFVPGHGNDLSNISPLAALDPLVALLQNGPRKGADPGPVREVSNFSDLEGFWKLHADLIHPDLDGNPDYIINLSADPDPALSILLDITRNGAIKVTNPRNGFTKTYEARSAVSVH